MTRPPCRAYDADGNEIRPKWTDRSVKQDLELLSWTRELLTGWNFVTGQGKPFLER